MEEVKPTKTTKNAKKGTKKGKTAPPNPDDMTQMESLKVIYKNTKKSKTLRQSMALYCNFVIDKILAMSKEQRDNVQLNYPFLPDSLFSRKQTFFIIPVSLL